MASERLDDWSHRAWDLPGYGHSSRAPEALSLADQAAVVADRCRRLAARRVVIIGHSMGGVIGLELCEQSPDVVTGFVNVEGNVSLGDCTYSGRAAECELDAFVAEGYDRLRSDVDRAGADDEAHRRYGPSLALGDPRAFHRNGCELVELSRREQLATRQSALATPSLYVQGSDGAGPHSRELLDTAGVAVETIEPAGHWPFIDRAEDFLDAVSGFLTRGIG